MKNVVESVVHIINDMSKENDNLIIAIEGRCASGKTTLAAELQKIYDCNVFHMDEFFLRPKQRTRERLEQAGENVDHERFLQEVLLPLKSGDSFSYCPYSCIDGCLMEQINIEPKKINIIEGSYSCHNNLYTYYDIKIFLTVDKEEQLQRIVTREGQEKLQIFKEKWIPMEEEYFSAFDIVKRCDYFFKLRIEVNR